jgi:anti-sigma B factor antagonist
MGLDIQEREREGIFLLDLRGRLVVGEANTQVREALHRVVDAGVKNVILNLAGVDYIDSTGLGTLVICYTTLKKNGGTAKLLNLTRRNLDLLVLTKLTTVFEIFNDEQDAVNSFFPNREIKRFDILSFIQSKEESSH